MVQLLTELTAYKLDGLSNEPRHAIELIPCIQSSQQKRVKNAALTTLPLDPPHIRLFWAIEITDRFFGLSVMRHSRINLEYEEMAVRATNAYLALYLPAFLQPAWPKTPDPADGQAPIIPLRRHSPGSRPLIDDDCLAGDERCLIRCEIKHSIGYLLRRT